MNRWRSFLSEYMGKVKRRKKKWGVLKKSRGLWSVWHREKCCKIRLKSVVEARMWETLNARLRSLDLRHHGFCTKVL